jgi:hypothetical protein
MFRWIDIDVMNVIFSKSIARDAGGKPGAAFPHPALEHDPRKWTPVARKRSCSIKILEHRAQKCARFCARTMLYAFDSGA